MVTIERIVFVVIVAASGYLNFVGKLVVHADNAQESDDSAEKTTDVGQSIVDFSEGPCDGYWDGGFSQIKFQVLFTPYLIVHDLCRVQDNTALVLLEIFHRPKTFIGLNRVWWNEQVGINAICLTEREIVHIVQISSQVNIVSGINNRVDEIIVEIKGLICI